MKLVPKNGFADWFFDIDGQPFHAEYNSVKREVKIQKIESNSVVTDLGYVPNIENADMTFAAEQFARSWLNSQRK